MKTLKIMSIIGIVLFALGYCYSVACQYSDPSLVWDWAVVGSAYGLAFAIVALVQAKRQIKKYGKNCSCNSSN